MNRLYKQLVKYRKNKVTLPTIAKTKAKTNKLKKEEVKESENEENEENKEVFSGRHNRKNMP